MYWLYVCIFSLVSPLLLIHAWVHARTSPQDRRSLAERLGRLPFQLDPNQQHLWIHAASVGEVNLAHALIKALNTENSQIILTTSTSTGAARAHALFQDTVFHTYIPYDLGFAVKCFIRSIKPTAFIVMETELWPTLYRQLGKQQIPIFIANARISPKSFRWYRKLRSLTQTTLSHVSIIGAQSDVDTERYLDLGALSDRTKTLGNLKFDLVLNPDVKSLGADLRASWGTERPVFIAASTHEGEESIALTSYQQLKHIAPNLLMIIAPRHPARGEAIARILDQTSLNISRRGAGETATPETDIVLADTLGELMMLYAASDIAFIGGSFADVGGHNPIEAAALNLPVIVGPLMYNFEAITRLLQDAEGLKQVQDEAGLTQVAAHWLQDKNACELAGKRGNTTIAKHRGALARHLKAINQIIH